MTFMKDDHGKEQFGLFPPNAQREIVKVLTYGARKYSPNNWCENAKWSRYIDAFERHWNSWKMVEDNDKESGFHHLAHAGCCLMFLLEYSLSQLGEDDRIGHAINKARNSEASRTLTTVNREKEISTEINVQLEGRPYTLDDLIVDWGICDTSTEVRKLFASGQIRIDDEVSLFGASLPSGKHVLQVGKEQFRLSVVP